VSADLKKQEALFDKGGFRKVETNPDNVVYEVPKADGSGTFYSRLQQGKNPRQSDYDGNRIVNTQNTGNTKNKQYVHPDGTRIYGAPSKEHRKAIGHVHLEPKP